jgi:hypothetical protein
MSDAIKHECGLAFIRLRKSFSYYQQQYGTVMWGLNKLYLLMEKQHNRGQDGAGVAAVKLNVEPGYPFLSRMRSNQPQPIADMFQKIGEEFKELQKYNRYQQTCRPDERPSFFLGEVAAGPFAVWHAGKKQRGVLPSVYQAPHHSGPQPGAGRQFQPGEHR